MSLEDFQDETKNITESVLSKVKRQLKTGTFINTNTYLIGSSLSGLFRVNWNLEKLFLREGKTGVPGEKPLGALGREPTTNSTHI